MDFNILELLHYNLKASSFVMYWNMFRALNCAVAIIGKRYIGSTKKATINVNYIMTDDAGDRLHAFTASCDYTINFIFIRITRYLNEKLE